MVVLGMDRSRYPTPWLCQLTPAPDDTMLFQPHEVRIATLTMQAVGVNPSTGTLEVSESLLPEQGYGGCSNGACGDSTCGGFIRVTGGCAVTLVVQAPTAALASVVSAQADPDRVRISWFCGSAVEPGARIERRIEDSEWQDLAPVSPDGSGMIVFEDRNVVAGARYGYRLGLRFGAVESDQGEIWIDVPLRFALALQGLRPNPSGRDVTVRFSLPDRTPATFELIDVAGRCVVRREVGSLGPGNHVLVLGQETAIRAGFYVLRLHHGAQTLRAKGTVLR
jgi:hypothetical protein